MNCAKVRELASEYVEGTLPAALERAARAHADACPACAADLAALRALWAQLDTLPPVEPPPFFHENVMAAVEQQARRADGWRALLPRLGRVALGTLATGGALAAAAGLLLLPRPDQTQEAGLGRVGSVLPGTAYQETTAAPPRLQIARKDTVDADHGPAYQFTVWLEEATHGTARFDLLSGPALARQDPSYRFVLTAEQPQSLVVPFAAVRGDVISLRVSWTANSERHTKYLFVPLPADDAAPEVEQSFGLPLSSLLAAAREVAVRYRRPVTLEDVPPLEKVAVTARQETATSALRRALAGRGVRVSLSGSGILVEPDAAAAAAVPGR